MTQEIMNDLIMLEKAGMNPQVCNFPVPYYDSSVRAGVPTDPGAHTPGEYLCLPRDLVGKYPTFVVNAEGDSMKEAGILDGDLLWVKVGVTAFDGDIVVVSINNETTVKAFYTDENRQKWLIPYNKDYSPIRLTEDMDVNMIGVVTTILRNIHRMPYNECIRIVNHHKSQQALPISLGKEDALEAIRQAAPMVKTARQWYAVFRTLVDADVLTSEAYITFVEWTHEAVPGHEHLPNARELRRMAVQSFARPVDRWNRDNAPVSGQRYSEYLQVAGCANECLKMAQIRHANKK